VLIIPFLTNPAANVPPLLGALYLHRTQRDVDCGEVLPGICSLNAKGDWRQRHTNFLTKPLGYGQHGSE